MPQEKTDDLKQIASVVRALIASRKPPCFLRDILKDYVDVENTPIPYRSFGYHTVEELLMDTGDFTFSTFGNGDAIITTKLSPKTAHITAMVKGQKKSKSSNSMRKPRLLHQTKNMFGDQNNNQSSYNPFLNNTRRLKPGNILCTGGQPKDLRDMLDSKKKFLQSSPLKSDYYNEMHDFRPILGASNSCMENNPIKNPFKREEQKAEQKKMNGDEILPRPSQTWHVNVSQMCTQAPKQESVNNEKPNRMRTSSSIQQRLKNLDKPEVKGDSIKQLSDYCTSRGHLQPTYNVLKSKYSKNYLCTVQVHESTFSTYPNEYETEYLAKEACSLSALNEITAQDFKEPLPVSSFSEAELINNLYKELLKYPHGRFVKNLPELFENRFCQSLPENWWALIQASNRFLIEVGLNNKIIIFANVKEEEEEQYTENCLENKAISLPWPDDHWNIFITHCRSTTDIWGRLFGNNHSVRFELLMSEVEAYMTQNKKKSSFVVNKQFYLILLNEDWHRVQVKEVDTSTQMALCFFIDYGDTDWFRVDQLFVCERHFLDLQAQAVQFSLHGLDDFENNPYARKYLDELLLNKSVVGKILTKESEYNNDTQINGKIQVVLFDTSTPEDINLNDHLLNAICSDTPAPEIKGETIANVFVTHICDDGDLYVQVRNAELNYVERLIQQTVESKLEKEQHKVTCKDLINNKLYLIYDEVDKNNAKWYRGQLVEATIINANEDSYKLFYIDCGLTRRVNICKIFLLETLSVALSRFPPQAIKVRLHNIPKVTAKTVARIQDLLPLKCEALMKLVKSDRVPLVTVYTRLDASNTLCTVNDTIRIEDELEKYNANNENTCGMKNDSKNFKIYQTCCNILRKLEYFGPMPKIQECFEVRVALSINPSNFMVQPYKQYPALRTLMQELQDYCKTSDKIVAASDIEVGQAYAAINCDGFFHRVVVTKKCDDMVRVTYCDIGEREMVEIKNLKVLPMKFRQLPKMAIKAKLYGIKSYNGDWSADDCKVFRKLTVGKTFISIVKRITQEPSNSEPSPVTLDLELIDVSTNDDVYIHEVMLSQSCGIPDC